MLDLSWAGIRSTQASQLCSTPSPGQPGRVFLPGSPHPWTGGKRCLLWLIHSRHHTKLPVSSISLKSSLEYCLSLELPLLDAFEGSRVSLIISSANFSCGQWEKVKQNVAIVNVAKGRYCPFNQNFRNFDSLGSCCRALAKIFLLWLSSEPPVLGDKSFRLTLTYQTRWYL